jgi:hypothetical protein
MNHSHIYEARSDFCALVSNPFLVRGRDIGRGGRGGGGGGTIREGGSDGTHTLNINSHFRDCREGMVVRVSGRQREVKGGEGGEGGRRTAINATRTGDL